MSGALTRFRSVRQVRAAEIIEVTTFYCYLKEADGTVNCRFFEDGMTDKSFPEKGDFWVVHEDGSQTLRPRVGFLSEYKELGPIPDGRLYCDLLDPHLTKNNLVERIAAGASL